MSFLQSLRSQHPNQASPPALTPAEAAEGILAAFNSGARALTLAGVPGSGRTRCAIGVAVGIARDGCRVAFVDASSQQVADQTAAALLALDGVGARGRALVTVYTWEEWQQLPPEAPMVDLVIFDDSDRYRPAPLSWSSLARGALYVTDLAEEPAAAFRLTASLRVPDDSMRFVTLSYYGTYPDAQIWLDGTAQAAPSLLLLDSWGSPGARSDQDILAAAADACFSWPLDGLRPDPKASGRDVQIICANASEADEVSDWLRSTAHAAVVVNNADTPEAPFVIVPVTQASSAAGLRLAATRHTRACILVACETDRQLLLMHLRANGRSRRLPGPLDRAFPKRRAVRP